MAKVRPFPGIRPQREYAQLVASRPYDVMNTQEAREEAGDNRYSFLHVVRADIDFPDEHNPHDMEVYKKAARNFNTLVGEGIMVQDPAPYMYVYRQVMGKFSQTGLVALSSVDDYFDDVIKKHEFTRPIKEQDRMNHMRTTGIHSGPVFLTYPDITEINTIVKEVVAQQPEYDFEAVDGVRHVLWTITDEGRIKELQALFSAKVPFTYIADGHHRAASSAKVGREMHQVNPGHTGEEAYNHFLSVLFPASELNILDYNRVLKDLNGFSKEDFLNRLSEHFEVTEKGVEPYKPAEQKYFGMYMDGKWYALHAKPGSYSTDDPVENLDVSVLQKNVFGPLFNIQDQRTDDRVDFVGGIRGLKELEKRVNSGEMKVAFALFPVTIQQLMQIADSGEVMPPKSTWFEPKLRSGLVVHKFK